MIKEIGKNKYRLIVSVGGREDRRRYTKTVECRTKKELRQLYSEFEAECQGTPLTDITVRQLLDAYVSHCKTLGRKATTIRGYEIAVERLSEPLQRISAKNCTTYHLEKEIALMSQNRLSAKSIKNTISIISAAYRHAIRIGQLEDNPCERLTLPKGQPREIRILYIDEIPKFLDAISDVDLNEKVAYELALFMGLRRSEILGLKESDVDIVKGMLSVHQTRHRVDGEDITSDTKTKRSTRVLALPDILIIDLARLMQIHRDFKYESTDYLIQNGAGEPLGGQALSSRLVRLEKEKCLPNVTIHGLRHTYASLLHSQGVDMANISAELGHSNLTTTANVYTHIFKNPSQSSKGIAGTINQFVQIGGTSVAHEELKKP